MMQHPLVLSCCLIPFLFSPCITDFVEMKIVDDVSNYGWNVQSGPDTNKRLTPKEKPAAFSGPKHLKCLLNKCFSLVQQDYKYELCLFNNATQHEKTMRWNPYSGILGIWTEWEIKNNTFISMMMKNGDDCGRENRQVRVVFACGTSNNLTSVSEPSRCEYELVFTTPLVCHRDSMLVYPVLTESHRHEWNEIEQELFDEIITEKGYKAKLAQLFYKAGLQSKLKKESSEYIGFNSLEVCNAKYLELFQEMDRMKKN